MGRIGKILSWALAQVSGNPPDVKVDPGGEATMTAEHYAPAGDDSQPLPGDFALIVSSGGTGKGQIAGYLDPNLTPKAGPGEKRIYARNASGAVACALHLKSDGEIEIESIQSGSAIVLNGVRIDQNGNISAPGDVTAFDGGAFVTLSGHIHPTGVGPSDKPTPGQ